MTHTSGPGVVTAANMPAKSAAICAAVVPVLVISVLPFVTDAGFVLATAATVASRN